MVDLTLLGCGGGMPMPNRYLSALCINYKGRKILVDCGEGTQVSMRMCNLGFKTIDVICITHIHGDHIVGLPGLLGTIGNSGRVEPLTIIGPEGIKEAVKGLRVIANWLPYEVNVIENSKGSLFFINDEIRIDTVELDHSSPCLGYSFYIKRMAKFNVEKAIENKVPKELWSKLQKTSEEIEFEGRKYTPEMVKGESRRGIKIAMTTDTRPLDEIIPFIEDSDLFVCEGTYGDDGDIEKAIKNKHMTFREAATLAKKANVERLLLTHFSTAMDSPERYINNATEVFQNTIIGEDRLELNLTFKE